jgi:DNA segregation ATPase FtsK/SpoIIIE, S-DNA-T family
MSNRTKLQFLIGTSDDGQELYGDFQKTGHFISSGHVGSGHASYDEGAFVTYLLQNYSPEELKFIMIDPKWVQLTPYEDIPYLLTPVAYNPDDAKAAVILLLNEVDHRFELLAQSNAKDIEAYNEQTPEKLPYIILLATEIADLMMVDRSFYESAFITLAMKAKAVGIHMYIATQRPSADVLTDQLLANVFGRIIFAVASELDSQRLLNSPDAATITKQGQLIFSDLTTGQSEVLQAPYITDDEIVAKVGMINELS